MFKNAILVIGVMVVSAWNVSVANAAAKPMYREQDGQKIQLTEAQVAAVRAVEMEAWEPRAVAKAAKYSNHLFTSYLGAAKSYAKAQVEADIAKDTKKGADLRAQADKLAAEARKREAALRADQEQIGKRIAAKNAEITKASIEASMIQAAIGSPNYDQAKHAQVTTTQERLNSELASLQAQLAGTSGVLADSINAASNEKRSYDSQIDALAGLMNKDGDVRGAQELKYFDQGVELMFKDMEKKHFDAQFMLTNLDVLQLKNSLNNEQLEKVRERFDNQLGDTLMGQYVNEQIRKAMLKICDIRNSCPATGNEANTQAITDVIQKALMAPREGAPMKRPAKANSASSEGPASKQ
ncbi:MAG: hypothetical protein A2X94_11395 [Bdellovibrionales bacterium GWB1_55_8]|nr:MAG: hypothetical protein A2X94_11395 [Bdellovibrionales bacterium GWB1_55_8]